jgi:hypothetical protein
MSRQLSFSSSVSVMLMTAFALSTSVTVANTGSWAAPKAAPAPIAAASR